MAVRAGQQFLQNPPLLSGNNGDGSAVGWVDDRGELPVELCRRLVPQQRQMATATTSLATQIEKERREIDQFLYLQSERLRVALQQQMKQHLLLLMRTLEAKASALLTQKEEELARASRTAAELEERLRRSEAESQAWQKVARENEAMALALSSALEQARDNATGLPPASPPDPATSSCNSSSDPSGGGRGGEPDSWGGQGEAVAGAGRCRGCGVRDSRVLFFPCMHLCACELCDALLAACPVCSIVKQGSMEVFIP